MPFVSAPSSIDSTDEALSIAQRLLDGSQRTLFARPEGSEISCRSGCTACCSQPVPVGPAELRALHRAIDELEPEHREAIRLRISEHAARLRSLGFTVDDFAERADLASAYFDAGVPCPLLDGDTCAVRDARPLACREYLVVSDPIHCDVSPGSGEVVRLHLRSDVIGGYSRLEHEAGDNPSMVLALALDEPPPVSAPFEPRLGREVIELLRRPSRSGH